MQNFIDWIGTALAWLVVLARLGLMIRGDASRRVKAAWFFALFLSLYGTFQIDVIAVFFDGVVGIHNLSLLISHIFLDIAACSVCLACLPDDVYPRWLLFALIVAIALSTVTFAWGPAGAPEDPTLTQAPEKASYLIFEACGNFFVMTVLIVLPLRHLFKVVRSPEANQSASSQTRSLAFLMALLAGWMSLASRLVVSTIAFLAPSLSISPTTMSIISLTTLLLVISWPLVLLPNKLLLVPRQIQDYANAVATSVDLARLARRLNYHFEPVYPDHPSWWDHLKQPAFHTYRSMINILDGKRKLANPEMLINVLGDHDLLEITSLRQMLLSVPDSSDYESLVARYRAIAKKLRSIPGQALDVSL